MKGGWVLVVKVGRDEFLKTTGSGNHELRILWGIGNSIAALGGDGRSLDGDEVAVALDELNGDELVVRIDSGGGDAAMGFAIYDAIRRAAGRFRTVQSIVEREAHSMAGVIALAADRRAVRRRGSLKVHRPRGRVEGRVEELLALADLLRSHEERMVDVYAERTGCVLAQVRAWLEECATFSADRALEVGLVDEIVTEPWPYAGRGWLLEQFGETIPFRGREPLEIDQVIRVSQEDSARFLAQIGDSPSFCHVAQTRAEAIRQAQVHVLYEIASSLNGLDWPVPLGKVAFRFE